MTGHLVVEDWQAPPAAVAGFMRAVGALEPQSSLPWFQNYVAQVSAPGTRPRLHVALRGGVPVAALALQHGSPGQVLSLGNYYTCRYGPLLADASDLAAIDLLVDGLLRHEAPLDRLHLQPLDPHSPAWGALQAALRRRGFAVSSHHCFQNWQLPVQGSFDDYFAQRDGSVRNTWRRMHKRFDARGGRIQLITTAQPPEADLASAIAAYVSVYAASWKVPEPYPGFMPGLIRSCAQLGTLRMAVAWLSDEAVAAQVWLVADGRAEIYKLAHKEGFRELSPGTLLTVALMRQVIDIDRVAVVDFLSGDDAYKRLWMTEVHERHGLVAYNTRRWRGLLGLARDRLGQALRPWRARLAAWRARGKTEAAA